MRRQFGQKCLSFFACGAGGNALDFVAHMEELNPNNTSDLRKAAMAAADIFNIDAAKEKPEYDRRALKNRFYNFS